MRGEWEQLRKGYTTGSCAAAAAKAATGFLYGTLGTLAETPNEATEIPAASTLQESLPVDIPLPYDGRLIVKAERIDEHEPSVNGNGGVTYQVIKDGGDDPDATHGMAIRVTALPAPEGIHIDGGLGVGRVTKPGLAVPVGEAAINPTPRAMITAAVKEALPPGKGVRLTVWAPEGERVGPSTLNPHLGVVGGISILGTTGIVNPMSEEAFKHSLEPQIDIALAAGHRTLLLTPGHMGRRGLEQRGAPADAIVLTSNFIGHMLDACAKKGVQEILLWGHVGKLVKVAGGIFHTHSKVADGRREIIAAHAAVCGLPLELVQAVLEANTAEAAVELLHRAGRLDLFDHLAEVAAEKAAQRFRGTVSVIFTDLKGEPLGWSRHATLPGFDRDFRSLSSASVPAQKNI
ncbi:cobalamin biosynthesis protein CbiD [Heliobacterium undosum]|uniref:Cobalt-precorrin-5B C(1)-methyltransferase n=1 Tax=Heliomicrobium undosum TaxID=121734 RepID=A0A845L221_9FIRM|nr:cobalt-precorrin-5B (C(1))-methyltransferase CbiD [Heliomicrobium undosum]MZP28530.1 cobalamin biosynthesis protein CbiD [Heliomicrobium undosum]